MKLSATACVAALSASVVSASIPWFGSQDAIGPNDAAKVPGDNPLEFCDTDHSKDIVHIEKVDLLPNPPEAYVLPIFFFSFLSPSSSPFRFSSGL